MKIYQPAESSGTKNTLPAEQSYNLHRNQTEKTKQLIQTKSANYGKPELYKTFVLLPIYNIGCASKDERGVLCQMCIVYPKKKENKVRDSGRLLVFQPAPYFFSDRKTESIFAPNAFLVL